MKKETLKGLMRVLVFFLPLGLTLYGYLSIHEETFLNAAFLGASMYVMNYGDTPPNLYIEIARWLAPLATASGVVFAFMALREKVIRRFRYLCGDSIAVYGDGADAEDILAQLGRKGIHGPERQCVMADRYILMFSDEEENYDLQDEYQRVESIYMEEKVKYDTLENRFRLSQAGILASQLKENQPCPVCGSLNHPHLANFNEGIVYQEDLKNAKQVFDKCSERRNDLYNTLM